MNSISEWNMQSIMGALDSSVRVGASPAGRWYYPASAGGPSWADASLSDQLSAISKLAANWDGYGAEPIEPTAIASARKLLERLTPTPDVIMPSTAGTVVIEWETTLGRANLELGRQTFSFYTSPRLGEPTFLSGDAREEDAEEINYALAAIAATSNYGSVSSNDWRSGIALLDEARTVSS
jgi:hypothetical protein